MMSILSRPAGISMLDTRGRWRWWTGIAWDDQAMTQPSPYTAASAPATSRSIGTAAPNR